MKLRPVHDKIVVKAEKVNEENRTEGGIILPDTVNQNDILEGEVVASGHGMYSATGTLIPICVEVGDTILYNKNNGGQEYQLDGESVIIMSQNEVLSILDK
jgi:chaperonin GroES